MENTQPHKRTSVWLLLVLLLVVLGAYALLHRPAIAPVPENPAAQDLRPGQTGPDPTGGWKTFTDSVKGISFKYPADLGTTYISTVDWPPQIEIVDQPYKCTAAGSQIQPAGETKEETINGHTYCVTRESEGAAGSTYTQYAYGADRNGQMAFLRFSLRFVQCANYDEPKSTECQTERSAFDVGPTVDQMFQTITTTQ